MCVCMYVCVLLDINEGVLVIIYNIILDGVRKW